MKGEILMFQLVQFRFKIITMVELCRPIELTYIIPSDIASIMVSYWFVSCLIVQAAAKENNWLKNNRKHDESNGNIMFVLLSALLLVFILILSTLTLFYILSITCIVEYPCTKHFVF